MAYATAKEILKLKTSAPDTYLQHPGVGTLRAAALRDEDHAQQILDATLQRTLDNRHGKGIRPWHIVDVTTKLDPAQPWLGFEYEMGLNTKDDYDKLINFVWRNINHCAIDKEGFGTYCPEITFSPENLENYMNGTSCIHKLLGWMKDNSIKLANFGDYPVGTHLNVSTPAFRALGTESANVAYLIAASLLMLSAADHRELFGRVAYGIGQHGEGKWIEFKIFRSTDDLAAFDKYVQVGRHMAELVERVSRLPRIPSWPRYQGSASYVHNIKDILLGKVPAAELDIRVVNYELPIGGWRSVYNNAPDYGLTFHKLREEKKNAA